MFTSQPETRFDLRFVAFRFPVRVSVWFWLGGVLVSPGSAHDLSGRLGPAPLLIWLVVIFLSILLHELGHAFAFRHYRVWSRIELNLCCGLAIPDGRPRTHWQDIAVSLAGPATNFAVAALLWATNLQTDWAMRSDYLRLLYGYAFFANLGWGLFNLLPIWPLDGGQVCRSLCYIRKVRQPEALSLKIGIGTAGFLILLGLLAETGQLGRIIVPVLDAVPWWLGVVIVWMIPGRFQMVFLFLLGYACWEALQQFRRARYFYDDDQGWR